ncbi:MAG: hypothetical protein ACW98Y_09845 [Candidatus Thorarchaeota archaeon]|jgi:hypothetical protein
MMIERMKQLFQQITVNQIIAIMIFVTLVFPVMVVWQGGTRSGDEWIVHVTLLAVTWIYLPPYWDMNSGAFGVMGGGLHILNPSATLLSLIMTIFNILFAIQVIRFCKNESSRRAALVPGVLSLVLPLLMAWQAYSMYVIEFMLGTGIFVYIGPVPIQLIVGIFFMRFAGPWKDAVIWDDSRKEQSDWWDKDETEQVEPEKQEGGQTS